MIVTERLPVLAETEEQVSHKINNAVKKVLVCFIKSGSTYADTS